MSEAKKKIIQFINELPEDFSHESIILTLVIQDMKKKGIPLPGKGDFRRAGFKMKHRGMLNHLHHQ